MKKEEKRLAVLFFMSLFLTPTLTLLSDTNYAVPALHSTAGEEPDCVLLALVVEHTPGRGGGGAGGGGSGGGGGGGGVVDTGEQQHT